MTEREGRCQSAQLRTGCQSDSLARWTELAEALGYHLVMISDHVAITPDVEDRYPAPFYDPFTTLAWLAGRTRRQIFHHIDIELLQVPAGPTPESIRGCGELMAPPHRITSAESIRKSSPPLSASMPTALLPSSTTRCASTSDLTVRFSGCRNDARFVSAVLMRVLSTLFSGQRPTPIDLGWFWAGVSGYPAATHASQKALALGSSSSRL